MKSRKAIPRIGVILAVELIFAGCNAPDKATMSEISGNPSSQESLTQEKYAQSVLRLKKEIKDPVLLSQKVQELKSEFAFNDPAPTQEEIEFAIKGAEEAMSKMREEGGPPADEPESGLAKTAAGYTLVKNYSLNIRKTYTGSVYLSPYQNLTITANAIGSADPFLVLYSSRCSGGAPVYFTHNVLGWDDDGAGGLSSRVSYNSPGTCNGGGQTIYYIVFSANAEAGIGNVNLVVNSGGTITNITNVPARGVGAVSNNAGTRPCAWQNVWNSQISVSGSTWRYFALNAAWNRTTSIDVGWGNPSVADVVPDYSETGTPNYLVPYVSPGASEYAGSITQSDYCP